MEVKYRTDIDGLRAVAVLAVVVYHAVPSLIPGGFFGVDIFFVISGYLITGIIHRALSEGRFSVAEFYVRRVRRIFPALILVVSATFAIGWFVLPTHEMQSLGSNIAGGALFAQNFVLLGQIGYFDVAANLKPLLHLWSLGIEEQYYVVWPLILLLVCRWRLSALHVALALALASFVACLLVGETAPQYAFYLPGTRAWELLVGSALALWHGGNFLGRPNTRTSAAISIVAALIIAGSFWIYSPSFRDPGWFTLLPVLATAALVGCSETVVHRALSTPLAVLLGLISYPLYLWHFPLMAYAHILFGDNLSAPYMLVIVVISFPAAWLTYRVVETPLRYGKKRVLTKVVGLITAMALLGCVGIAAASTGLPQRLPREALALEAAQDWREDKALYAAPKIVILGDSHAGQWEPGLRSVFHDRVVNASMAGCPSLLGLDVWANGLGKGNCAPHTENVFRDVISKDSVEYVIISNYVIFYVTGIVLGDRAQPWGMALSNSNATDGRTIYEQAFKATVDALLKLNKKVIVIKDVPELGFKLSECIPRILVGQRRSVCGIESEEYRKRVQEFKLYEDELLDAYRDKIAVYDPAPQLCDEHFCYATKDGQFLYRDSHHLSAAGSAYLSRELLAYFSEKSEIGLLPQDHARSAVP
ncbi:acyltransferase family protein [Bradyrhizobium sp. HKCCYLS1011]|uniref:acyltransferase family protein n=1 Tax=Bradyrhizobium sp. HKCCYLS1011 TaxID=3420733 RepID=UPI003EBA5B51